MNQQQTLSYSYFRPDQALEAVRASGFRTTAEALFELIDNSIDAGARNVEVFGVTKRNPESGFQKLVYLAVLDDGEGMDVNTLRRSLRFGDGTRTSRRGSIGRFGVGLPQASISQAEKVSVWSWQNGVSNSITTYLSTAEIQSGSQEVPKPSLAPIPDVFKECSRYGFEDSGTLVVWSQLSSITWAQATTTFSHLDPLVGRIYRNFLTPNSDSIINIDLIPIEIDDSGRPIQQPENVTVVRPNDPMFLMENTSSDEGFGKGPMFREHSASPLELKLLSIPIERRSESGSFMFDSEGNKEVDYKDFSVTLRCSYAKRCARNPDDKDASWPEGLTSRNPGDTPWGKRADKNRGVTVVRGRRELELQTKWTGNFDPIERWWSIEVSFSPELDAIFGVTNNKQSANRLNDMADFHWKTELIPGETSRSDVVARMKADGDSRVYLIELVEQIEKFRTDCMTKLREQTTGTRSTSKRHEVSEEQRSDREATSAITGRISKGNVGESDSLADGLTDDQIAEENRSQMVTVHGIAEENALAEALGTIESGNKVRIISTPQDSPSFFTVDMLPGTVQVALNTNHAFYDEVWAALNAVEGEIPEEEYASRLEQIKGSLRLLLYSWARMEDENPGDLKDIRWDWGRILSEFLQNRPGHRR